MRFRLGRLFVRARVLAIVAALATAWHAPADAQMPEPARTAPTLTALGLWTGRIPLGSTPAELTGNSGDPVRLFGAENRAGMGIGATVHVGVPAGRRVAFEGVAGWTHTSLESRVFADIEDAPSRALATSISRLTVEGAVVWTVAPAARASLFVGGGGGWMRELAGGGILRRDGTVAHAAVGVKYWWAQQPAGPPARVGLRIEGRVHLRSQGISLGDGGVGVAPAVAAGFVFRL